MIEKKHSVGFAWDWIFNMHPIELNRFIEETYTEQDKLYILRYFDSNPLQCKKILEDFIMWNSQKQEKVIRSIMFGQQGKSKIIYIIGARGSGKSVLAYWIAEQLHILNPYIQIYSILDKPNKEFPDYIKFSEDIESVPNDSFIILDEASIRYSAREYQKEANIMLGKYLAIARHKGISVIFITQHEGLIDINISRLRDIILWKRSNDYSFSETRGRRSKDVEFWGKIRAGLSPRKVEETLFEFPSERRFIKFAHPPPRFWSEQLSTLFSDYKFKKKEAVVVKAKARKPPKKDVY